MLQPYVYGLRWHEKPSLLSWLIAGFAKLTGGVNEWSARLPTLLSVLITALLVQAVTRRYAGPSASLFAALALIFCPLLLQKLTVAEPDTLVMALSFGALVVWWSGVAAGRLTILHWIGAGLLLAALAMAKGPQPAAFFGLGVLIYLMIERRFRDLPGWVLSMIIPAAAVVTWGAAIYRPGDEASWVSYARLNGWPPFYDYITRCIHDIGSLYLELLPASLLILFIPWPWRRPNGAADIPPVVAPMLLYTCVCTAVLVWWPGFNTRYAMPIAPSLAVLAGIAWKRLAPTRYAIMRRVATVILCLLAVYQFVISDPCRSGAGLLSAARHQHLLLRACAVALPRPASDGGARSAGLAVDAACGRCGIWQIAARSRCADCEGRTDRASIGSRAHREEIKTRRQDPRVCAMR